jgi:hypothetical protein
MRPTANRGYRRKSAVQTVATTNFGFARKLGKLRDHRSEVGLFGTSSDRCSVPGGEIVGSARKHIFAARFSGRKEPANSLSTAILLYLYRDRFHQKCGGVDVQEDWRRSRSRPTALGMRHGAVRSIRKAFLVLPAYRFR